MSASLVLEYVEGETLAAWLADRPRPWRQILEVFLRAADGLAAAHEAGLIHGDFKPQNVLLDRDGRPRVADFGLARAAPPPDVAGGRRGEPAPGTPHYMAPEQREGARPDARSDQYSFSLALAEALGLGDHVHEAKTPVRRAKAGAVPRGLFEVLRRGLNPRPQNRHASMTALALALGQAAARPRLWRAGAGAALLAVLLLSALVRARAPQGGDRAGAAAFGACGDGRVDPGEECDDGNDREDDGCSTRCLTCGGPHDGFLWEQNGHCYTLHHEPATWEEARNGCGARGGFLATYSHRSEANAVASALLARATSPVWIGMRREIELRGFLWITGGALDASLGDRLFPPAEPVELCVQQVPSSSGRGRWRAERCDGRHGYVCERRPWLRRPETGHAYQVFYDRLTFAQAEAACARVGGHLATLTDAAEHAAIAPLAGDYAWIGGTDSTEEGRFQWLTNEPFAFQAFAGDQPNDRAGDQDCLALGPDGRWHDWLCEAAYGYVCELAARNPGAALPTLGTAP